MSVTLPSARLAPLNLALSAAFWTCSRSEVKSDNRALNEAVFSEVSEAARAFSFILLSRSVMVSPAARATSIVDWPRCSESFTEFRDDEVAF